MFDFLSQQKGQPPALPEGTVRRRYSIEGQVQGVGFRYRARYAGPEPWPHRLGGERGRRLGHAGGAGRPGPLPQAVRPHPAQRLYPDHLAPPARPRPRPMGAGFPGARLLVNASYKHEAPRSPAFRGGCCASIRSSSALYYERVHCRGVLLKIRLSQIRGKCV